MKTLPGRLGGLLRRLLRRFAGPVEDREQLLRELRGAFERDIVDTDALRMLEGVVGVADIQVRDIMVPRSQVITVNAGDSPQDILPVVIKAQHSRFPVIGDSLDEVLGILLAKDLLPLALDSSQRKFDIKDVMRPATYVPESKRLNVLLKEFRENRNHMAIVIDEYGDLAGLCTIEDVLEQIVGEIEDEYDIEDEAFIKPIDDHSSTVKALTSVDDFNSHFGADFSTEEFDTIGGLIAHEIGHVPQKGESISIAGLRFEVMHAKGGSVKWFRLRL